MDAFDADVLIYAADRHNLLGRRVAALFDMEPVPADLRPARVGSVLLLAEVLSKPARDGRNDAIAALGRLLGRIELRPVDRSTAELAAGLAADYQLRAADASHLATAVAAGADRFVTNNRRDFPRSIVEVDVTYPDDLPDPVTV